MADERVDRFALKPFLDGPTEFLAKTAAKLLSEDQAWKKIFGQFIDSYEREDYQFRNLPALRFYCLKGTKVHESHYIDGEVKCDAIFPPSLRRTELQLLQDVVSGALIQQFRRPPFFSAMQLAVPGLNQLGKVVDFDKTLGMMVGDQWAPVTQFSLNFRIDLKMWDEYLEKEGRTKDDPFQVTLMGLEHIISQIEGWRGETPDTKEVEISIDQVIGG